MTPKKLIASTPAFALCLTLGVAGCASMGKEAAPVVAAPAVTEPVSGVVGENVVSATAVVKKIDQKTRKVTLQRADGSLIKFTAGENVRNLGKVKVGDEVTVGYYESLAYEVRKPGEATPGVAVAEQLARAKAGEKPGAVGAQVTTVTATITAIDKATMMVTLRSAEGETTSIKARDAQKLDRVAVGDLVEITYTEAIGITVDDPSAK